jgi:hypothetical protein
VQIIFRIPTEGFAEGEIADRGGVKNSVPALVRERAQAQAQIVRGGKGLDTSGTALAAPRRLLADEQGDFVAAVGEVAGEFGAETAGGMVRKPPHLVERLKRGTGSD